MDIFKLHTEKKFLLIEVAFFIIVFIILGVLLVPSHWTSLWADREFTGWVAPISNRFAQGQILYTDGAHIPMPPLPFAIIWWLSWGKAIWITESFLNFFFQSLTLLILFISLNHILPRPIPFLSILSTIPVFFALSKVMLYDSSTQFFVAISVLISTYYFSKRKFILLIFLGLSIALCTLCKQTSGIGTLIGVLIVMLFYPRKITLKDKLKELLIFVISFLLSFLMMCIILSPLISIKGMLLDVFISSSEVKGGFNNLFQKLYSAFVYGIGFGYFIIASLLTILVTNIIKVKEIKILNNKNLLMWGVYIFCVGWFLLFILSKHITFFPPTLLPETKLLNISFALLFILTYIVLLYRNSQVSIEIQRSFPILPLFIITFSAALFYNLSVHEFWWSYYNNPLIVFVIAGLYLTVLKIFNNFPRLNKKLLYLALAVLVLITINICSIRFKIQLDEAKKCIVPWSEIKYLKGAKLPESAQGVRDLVHLVQFIAPDSKKDAVLLLPNDPNVEAWFERPRPKLTSAIIFTDQYFDKYVDEDFRGLEESPPKVIIIGPRTHWRWFCRLWQVNRGTERLIDRVLVELIPKYYRLYAPQKIWYWGYHPYPQTIRNENYMDVFERIDKKETIYTPPKKQSFLKHLFRRKSRF